MRRSARLRLTRSAARTVRHAGLTAGSRAAHRTPRFVSARLRARQVELPGDGPRVGARTQSRVRRTEGCKDRGHT